MGKCNVIAGGNVEVSDLEADPAPPRAEPVLQPLGIRADGLQWRREVELDEILRLVCDHGGGVFGSYGLCPGIDHRSDLSFGRLGESLVRHDAASCSRVSPSLRPARNGARARSASRHRSFAARQSAGTEIPAAARRTA